MPSYANATPAQVAVWDAQPYGPFKKYCGYTEAQWFGGLDEGGRTAIFKAHDTVRQTSIANNGKIDILTVK